MAPVSYDAQEKQVRSRRELFKDNRGASASEYALLLAIIGGAIALAAIALGGAISNSVDKASNEISK